MSALFPYLWVGMGGFFGAIARFFVARVSASLLGVAFPYGTFLINISGSFLLGLIATLVAQRLVPYGDHIRLAVAVGFIGSYTTFSTYEFESNALIEEGSWMLATVNLVGSLLVGLIAVKAGIVLAKLLTSQ